MILSKYLGCAKVRDYDPHFFFPANRSEPMAVKGPLPPALPPAG
jgi:hypothetical protein